MNVDELEHSSDIAYWDSCIIAIANGDMSIESIHPNAKDEILQDVEHYNATGELPSEGE